MKKLYMGTIGDMKNLEHHYAHMAENGWMIEKIGLFTHHYRRIAPCKKRFFVDFLPQITAFDYPENQDAQDYRRICEESGWNFIVANKQFHVFCADEENNAPIPIHTDNSLQAKIYLKASKKYELLWLLYGLVMLWFFSPFGKGVELFLSNIYLCMTIGYFFLFFGYIWTVGFVIIWYIQTKKSAKNNSPMPVVNRRIANIRNKTFLAGVIALFICMVTGAILEMMAGMPIIYILIMFIPLSGTWVGLWVRRQIDTKKRSRGKNIALAITAIVVMEIALIGVIGFAIRKAPSTINTDTIGNRPVLTLMDVGISSEPTATYTDIKGTLAIPSHYEYWESNKEGSVRTEVYTSVNSTLTNMLYSYCTEKFMQRVSFHRDNVAEAVAPLNADELAFWGADKGMIFYSQSNNSIYLLLLKDKTIVNLFFESEDMDSYSVSQAVERLWKQ